jgi:hypothetical protein
MVLVGGGAVEPARHVLPGEHLDDARDRHGGIAADPDDPRMSMGERSTLRCAVRSSVTSMV